MSQRDLVPSHFMPLPELLSDDPGTYEIIDSREVRGLPTTGMVDQVNQLMFVPLDAAGRIVSRHECAHVLWTPVRPPKIRGYNGYLQAVEDGRINRGLRCIGLGIDLDEDQLARVLDLGENDLEHGDPGILQWALRTIASNGTNAEQPLLGLLEKCVPPVLPFDSSLGAPLQYRVRNVVVRTLDKLERARRREEGPVASSASVQRIARWLRREIAKLGIPEPKNTGTVLCCLGAGPARPGAVRRGRETDWLGRDSRGEGPGPGRMRVSQPPLIHRCAAPSRGVARGRRSATEGTMLRDIWRFSDDQKVFVARARRRGGASVLIDVSGSMSLSSEDIDKIIASAPEATLVAIYSGRGSEGELRIVVRDGQRAGVENLEPFGPSNVVDQPALEWLAKQSEPRIWISDGSVTGKGDTPSGKVKTRCAVICRRARITRVRTAAAAAKLTGGRSS